MLPGYFLSSNNKCFKIYHGNQDIDNIINSCQTDGGILSEFITNNETYAFIQLIKNNFKSLTKKYVDRGFTCYSDQSENCYLTKNDTFYTVHNHIEFLTDKYPCRGVMNITDLKFYCLEMNDIKNVIFGCQKNPVYIKNCTNYVGYEKNLDGNCYMLLEDIPFTKKTAEAMCKDKLGTLPVVINKFENFAMTHLLNKINSSFWLDFSCPTKNSSSCKWSGDEKMEYRKIKNLELASENLCGYIKIKNNWETDSCDTRKKVVCQIRNK